MVIGKDFNGHDGEGNRGDVVVRGRFCVKEMNLEGEMLVVNAYFQKRRTQGDMARSERDRRLHCTDRRGCNRTALDGSVLEYSGGEECKGSRG